MHDELNNFDAGRRVGVNHGSKDRCGATRKVRFKSEAHANWRIKEIQQEGMNARRLDAYHCDYCGGFHLTSKQRVHRK